MIKVGMPMDLINNPGLLMAYYALTLQVSESPFVLAHTVNYGNLSSLNKMVNLIKASMVNRPDRRRKYNALLKQSEKEKLNAKS